MSNMNDPKTKKGTRRKITAIVIGTALVIGGGAGVRAFAGSNAFSQFKLAAGGDGMLHRAHWRGHRRGHFAEMTDAEIDSKVERIVKHVSIEIDATAEQTGKITALVTAMAKNVKPLSIQMRDTRKQLHDILLAKDIDRAALEKIRIERIAEVDRVSKDLVNTLADVAEVLSAEQRVILDKRIREFRSRRMMWHRG